jgi:hypothetical protein
MGMTLHNIAKSAIFCFVYANLAYSRAPVLQLARWLVSEQNPSTLPTPARLLGDVDR